MLAGEAFALHRLRRPARAARFLAVFSSPSLAECERLGASTSCKPSAKACSSSAYTVETRTRSTESTKSFASPSHSFRFGATHHHDVRCPLLADDDFDRRRGASGDIQLRRGCTSTLARGARVGTLADRAIMLLTVALVPLVDQKRRDALSPAPRIAAEPLGPLGSIRLVRAHTWMARLGRATLAHRLHALAGRCYSPGARQQLVSGIIAVCRAASRWLAAATLWEASSMVRSPITSACRFWPSYQPGRRGDRNRGHRRRGPCPGARFRDVADERAQESLRTPSDSLASLSGARRVLGQIRNVLGHHRRLRGVATSTALAESAGHSPLAVGFPRRGGSASALLGLIGARLYHLLIADARPFLQRPTRGICARTFAVVGVGESLARSSRSCLRRSARPCCLEYPLPPYGTTSSGGVLAGGFWIRLGCVFNGCCWPRRAELLARAV